MGYFPLPYQTGKASRWQEGEASLAGLNYGVVDSERAERMARIGRRRFLESPAWEVSETHLIAAYRNVLDRERKLARSGEVVKME